MPSFSDSIFLFVLALLLFGPKRLPVLARELGKWVGEFRRASNEFKMQMEEELRLSEQADRQKRIAAIEAAAPVTPPIAQHGQPPLADPSPIEATAADAPLGHPQPIANTEPVALTAAAANSAAAARDENTEMLPIATSGDLRLMPPSTGLPTPQRSSTLHVPADSGSSSNGNGADPFGGMLDSIPEAHNRAEPGSAVRTETPAP